MNLKFEDFKNAYTKNLEKNLFFDLKGELIPQSIPFKQLEKLKLVNEMLFEQNEGLLKAMLYCLNEELKNQKKIYCIDKQPQNIKTFYQFKHIETLFCPFGGANTHNSEKEYLIDNLTEESFLQILVKKTYIPHIKLFSAEEVLMSESKLKMDLALAYCELNNEKSRELIFNTEIMCDIANKMQEKVLEKTSSLEENNLDFEVILNKRTNIANLIEETLGLRENDKGVFVNDNSAVKLFQHVSWDKNKFKYNNELVSLIFVSKWHEFDDNQKNQAIYGERNLFDGLFRDRGGVDEFIILYKTEEEQNKEKIKTQYTKNLISIITKVICKDIKSDDDVNFIINIWDKLNCKVFTESLQDYGVSLDYEKDFKNELLKQIVLNKNNNIKEITETWLNESNRDILNANTLFVHALMRTGIKKYDTNNIIERTNYDKIQFYIDELIKDFPIDKIINTSFITDYITSFSESLEKENEDFMVIKKDDILILNKFKDNETKSELTLIEVKKAMIDIFYVCLNEKENGDFKTMQPAMLKEICHKEIRNLFLREKITILENERKIKKKI